MSFSSTALGCAPTGSIVLVHGTSFLSGVVRVATSSYWSHVAVVVRAHACDEDEDEDGDRPLLLESTLGRDGLIDLLCGTERCDGPRLVDAEAYAQRHFDKDTLVRRLCPVPERLERTARDLIVCVRGRLYERRPSQLLLAVYDGPFGEAQRDLSSLFCSELVAELYRLAGLLPADACPSEYTPADFAVGGCVERSVSAVGRCCLSEGRHQ